MRTLEEKAVEMLETRAVKGPAGVPETVARNTAAKALLSHWVLQAYHAGVRPSYMDWLRLTDVERLEWARVAEEDRAAKLAELATACGNVLMAKRVLAKDDEEWAQDAVETGLAACGLL